MLHFIHVIMLHAFLSICSYKYNLAEMNLLKAVLFLFGVFLMQLTNIGTE